MLSKISVKHDKKFGAGWTQSVLLACMEMRGENGEQRILKLDESPSQVRNPKSESGLLWPRPLKWSPIPKLFESQFEISDFGLEMGFRPISKFLPGWSILFKQVRALHPFTLEENIRDPACGTDILKRVAVDGSQGSLRSL
jgi:hypothetical protein